MIQDNWAKEYAYNCLSNEEFQLLQKTYNEGDDLPCNCDDCGSYIINKHHRCNCGNRRCYFVYNKHLAPKHREIMPFSIEVD